MCRGRRRSTRRSAGIWTAAWTTRPTTSPSSRHPGLILALWDRGKLARDSGVTDTGGWGGVTLAYNVRSPEEVDAVLAEARAAGATIARPGAATFWGGYSGVFIDPDGHPWEVAHNPGWTIHDDGRTTLD
jgi:catechol 2,3-dioxygenase-like lactoylglutathione lyase family enzyme